MCRLWIALQSQLCHGRIRTDVTGIISGGSFQKQLSGVLYWSTGLRSQPLGKPLYLKTPTWSAWETLLPVWVSCVQIVFLPTGKNRSDLNISLMEVIMLWAWRRIKSRFFLADNLYYDFFFLVGIMGALVKWRWFSPLQNKVTLLNVNFPTFFQSRWLSFVVQS